MILYCPECDEVEMKWVCLWGNDQYRHECNSSKNRCYLSCPKCGKNFRVAGMYNKYSDYLLKEKKESKKLKQKITELEKENSELKDSSKSNENELKAKTESYEKIIKELQDKLSKEKKEKMNNQISLDKKEVEIQNLKIQLEKDLKIKELEYKLELTNIKNEYENKTQTKNIESELEKLKTEISLLKSENASLKNAKCHEILNGNEFELRCYSNSDDKFFYIEKIDISEKFLKFAERLASKSQINISEYTFKYNGKVLDKDISIFENGIHENAIIIMEKTRTTTE